MARAGDFEKAVIHLRKAVELNPRSEQARVYLERALDRLKRKSPP
ncbi:MAG: hypothetical protein AB1896_03185 [Thermodesulfobacteriota bacterium]